MTETAGSLKAYAEGMLRFVKDMERAVELAGNDVVSLDRPQRSRLRQPETNIKKEAIDYSACPNSRHVTPTICQKLQETCQESQDMEELYLD